MTLILLITILFLFGSAIFVPVMFLCNVSVNVKWYHWVCAIMMFLMFIIGGVCVMNIADNYNKPKAIDVYRGNTSLEIRYINSIPQDSTVIFKQIKERT